ncbi:MAG TPA: penicillin acylase family protein [Pyrinomonadaceae bacterium]|jgi:penicillin amidase|nr:penicillin acylase family protein [Pyrinomonadaceae bacterium]
MKPRILLLLSLTLVCVLASNQYSRRAGAQQTLSIAGLRAPVTVRRDERGIPYIEATNDDDLYFAQGYITASDRLWQMDLLRRNVRGEMAEIFGESVLTEDKRHRTFGFAHVVDETAKHLPSNLSRSLNAYADGVNAFIDSLNDQTTPVEFRALQYKPKHWTPADSLCVGKLLAEYLSNSWQLDIMRGAMMSLPKEKREALLVETSPLDVIVVGSDRPQTGVKGSFDPRPVESVSAESPDQINASLEDQRRSFELLGVNPANAETFQASNNWVVSGKHTASGNPLLANDPHIPASAPGIWYQTELTAPGMHVAGVTFPGAPGIVLGHNDYIAWGATNLGPDVQDVYSEKFDKDNPSRYQTPAGWRDAEIRHEQISVRKNPLDPKSVQPQNFDVTVTRHGPIILEKDGVRYALQWPALDPANLEIAGIFDANRARNWNEFTAAMSRYSGPTQNFVYADVEGHIGYYGAGKIPIRKSGDGSVPYDGSTDDGEWISYIPFDKLPHSFDPPSGIIVTANQRVVGHDYSYFLSHNWAPPYRARRIFELLSAKSKLTTDDFRRIQSDTYSIATVTFARAAAKSLKTIVSGPGATAIGSGDQLSKLISELESWDGMMNADSHTAAIASQMRGAFRTRILNAALGPQLASSYTWAQAEVLIDRIATEQPKQWLPQEFSTYADLFRTSYEDARRSLTKSIGVDESQWTWGKIAIARFQHPLAIVPFIGAQFVIAPFPQNGSGGSINVGSSVSMRLIADPSDWDKTQNGIPLGESGAPNNPHWKDQLDDWRKVTPRALPFSKAAVDGATKETVLLTPAK